MKKRVGLIFGGRSGEHEVSLKSAATIAASLDLEKFEIFPIFISRAGKWYAPIEVERISQIKWEEVTDREVILPPRQGGEVLSAQDGHLITTLDYVFPIVHGTNGEDGILQGFLEMLGIPYVGAGVAGSAVGMDKLLMREILAYHQIPQTKFIGLRRHEVEQDLADCLKRCEDALAYPMFIKPANGGSSVGISKAVNKEELSKALAVAARYDRKIIVEQGVNAREIELSVLGNWDNLQVAHPGEIIAGNDFYDYEAKYISQESVTKIPADLEPELVEKLQQQALKVYEVLDCEGFARVDFFVEKDTKEIYLNEINTLPGFTSISMYPKMWEADGLPIQELLTKLLDLAQQRFEDRQRMAVE